MNNHTNDDMGDGMDQDDQGLPPEDWEDWEDDDGYEDPAGPGSQEQGPPGPVNWNLLTAHELEQEWLALNRWVEWLRKTYALPASVIPPLWHRHPELQWELSALHLHWLCAYEPDQDGSAPIGWHRDFAAARQRLRDWVAASGTRLDRDRPSRQAAWPGEPPAPSVEDTVIVNRRADFVRFVIGQVARRQAAEDAFFARPHPARTDPTGIDDAGIDDADMSDATDVDAEDGS